MTIAARGLAVDLEGTRILDGVDLTLAPGGLIGLVGPNGAGKSTLARALVGLLTPAAGRVEIDGEAPARLGAAAVARRVAYLPQGQDVHWPVSVARLVALGRLPHLAPLSRLAPADADAIDAAMIETDVAHLADRIATSLSGGERARVLLARALATGAPAIVADEPLAALDPGHQIDVMALLRRRADAGGPVVVVLHDLTVAARSCDRLVLIDRGRVRADGPPHAVLADALLADVYGIAAWRGDVGGRPLIVPIRRLE